MRQHFFLTPFAATGDRESPPNAQQQDGSVSYAVGFGPNYSADPATDPSAKPVPREETNGLYYDLTNALRALQTEGAPEFITATDNGGNAYPYSRGAMVRWSPSGEPPFTTYVSRVNNNTAVPSNATNWSPLVFEVATNTQALGNSTSLLITPATLNYVLSETSVSVPPASTSVAGITQYATNAQAQNGAPVDRAVTPPALQSALSAYQMPAAQITSGVLDAERIPALPATRITSGTFNIDRIPVANISLNADQITSGALAVARGGTGLSSLAQNRYLLGNGTGPLIGYTPAQVMADLNAASLGGNTFTGTQNIAAASNPQLVLYTGEAVSGWLRGIGTTLALGSNGGGVFLRPVSVATSSGQTVIASNGNMTVAGSVTATGGFQGSSRTVKRDIRDVDGAHALKLVASVAATSFCYRPEYRDDGDRRSYGWIAEELAEVVPEAVRQSDGGSPLVVEHAQLTAVLWAAVQCLSSRIAELEARNGE